ncbi:MAG: nucleoside deaminase [Candidatus Dormibacteria bacterium]
MSVRGLRPWLGEPLAQERAEEWLEVALEEARVGAEEGGVPVGAALFGRDGSLLGRGRNRRVQDGDPAVHGETDAFRRAGRRRGYGDTVMVTTLAPCLFCSGLIRQFGIGGVVIGQARSFLGGIEELRAAGVEVVELDDVRCVEVLGDFVAEHPEVWAEDIGD